MYTVKTVYVVMSSGYYFVSIQTLLVYYGHFYSVEFLIKGGHVKNWVATSCWKIITWGDSQLLTTKNIIDIFSTIVLYIKLCSYCIVG